MSREHPQIAQADRAIRAAERRWHATRRDVETLPGYVWLDTPGKPLHVQERELRCTDQPPG
jgi:hypothetical protein